MNVTNFIVNVTSEQPDELAKFYADVVGLPRAEGMGPFAFMAGTTPFLIDGHSEVHGKTREPQRMLINFFVDDAKAEEQRLKSQGVKFIRSAGKEEWGGMISTFLDPDGNYMQIIEFKDPANA